MTRDLTYHCIPSLMFALCMPSDEVIYKDDMQGDEMHAVRTSRNPMQSAVILSVNTTIPPILEGPKDVPDGHTGPLGGNSHSHCGWSHTGNGLTGEMG